MKGTLVYVLYYSRVADPEFELIKIYANKDDAWEERENMIRHPEKYYYSYVLEEVIR